LPLGIFPAIPRSYLSFRTYSRRVSRQGATDPFSSNNGTYSTTITCTDTQGTSSTDPIDFVMIIKMLSDDNQNVAIQDAESGQAGGETVMNSLHTFLLTLHTFILMMNRQ
jgi:hypothetical protein